MVFKETKAMLNSGSFMIFLLYLQFWRSKTSFTFSKLDVSEHVGPVFW